MEKITASEIIGELKKAARLYQVFEEAEKILTVLAEAERRKRDLEIQIAGKQDELAHVTIEVDAKAKEYEAFKDRTQNHLENVNEQIQTTRSQLAMEMATNKTNNERLVEETQRQVGNLKTEIAKLKEDKKAAQAEYTLVADGLTRLKTEFHAAKDQLLQVFK